MVLPELVVREPRLETRRSTQAPLPENVSPLRREALINSSPKKAKKFLAKKFNRKAHHYDKDGRLHIKYAERVVKSKSPKAVELVSERIETDNKMDLLLEKEGEEEEISMEDFIASFSFSNLRLF
ncbi:hypothetical protein EG329_008032 [Mollisiaceae sp. DMI_Dod_QoI]|nr:hypothetical protein EG329_008032 [Helotiales sp. DMI_Dod_QoI]